MNRYGLHRDDSGAYIVRAGATDLAEFRAAEPNWWTGRRLPNGNLRRLYEPYDGTTEDELRAAGRVAVKLL